MTRILSHLTDRRLIGLCVALAVSAVLLATPSPARGPSGPVAAALAWPRAQTAAVPATLADGSAFTPLVFLDARTSIGTAPTPNGTSLRLLWRGPSGTLRPIRELPESQYPTFRNVAVAGDVLAWVEDTGNGADLTLWTGSLTDRHPPRRLASLGPDAVLVDGSPYDLTLHDGTAYWVTRDPARDGVTDLRSVPLAGGQVGTRTVVGSWTLSAWPWLVDGATDPGGVTHLRNLTTGQDIPAPRGGSQTTCSPTWCAVVSLNSDGSTQLAVMHPDGSARQQVSSGTVLPAVAEVAPLNRFEPLWQTDATLDLTHNGQLLVFDLTAHRTVELSPDAASVSCRNGVLWWSNGDGSRAAVTWHTLDLRTV